MHKVSEMRNEEVDKIVDVPCQFLIQNSRTDRQVKHKPKQDDVFLQTMQTPTSVGLSLAVHSQWNLVNNLVKSLTKEKRYDLIDAFNSTSRYLDDLLNIDNIHFEHMVHRIYPAELQLNKANASDTEAAF